MDLTVLANAPEESTFTCIINNEEETITPNEEKVVFPSDDMINYLQRPDPYIVQTKALTLNEIYETYKRQVEPKKEFKVKMNLFHDENY